MNLIKIAKSTLRYVCFLLFINHKKPSPVGEKIKKFIYNFGLQNPEYLLFPLHCPNEVSTNVNAVSK